MSAVIRLAFHRLRGRSAATLLLAAAAAAATGLTSTISTLGTSAADRALTQALASLPIEDRALQASAFPPSGDTAGVLDAAASAGLSVTGAFADEPVRGVIFRRAADPGVPYAIQLTAVDAVARWVELSDGRAPGPCRSDHCEAVLLSIAPPPADLPSIVHVAGLTLEIVGRGTLVSTLPLGAPDERGPRTTDEDPYARIADPSPALLLVDGVDAAAKAPGAAAVGRTMLWTAPLDLSAIHPWTVPALRTSLDDARTRLALADLGLELVSPMQTMEDALLRAAANDGRLRLVDALAVAILIAFAAATALLGRRDLGDELERLAAAGGGRAAIALLVAIEASVPILVGAAVGWIAATGLAAVQTAAVGGDPATLIVQSVLEPQAMLTTGVVVGAAVLAVVGASILRLRRATFAGLVPGFALAGLLVAWRIVAGDALRVEGLASDVNAPLVALLPAAIGLAVVGVVLVLMPRLLRRLSTVGLDLPLPVRLALISVARDAARPIATLIVLTFALGGLVFAAGESATLRRGAADEAAFATAMDLRVVESGTDVTLDTTVVPLDRYGALGPDVVTVPIALVNAEALPGGPTTVIGLPPEAIARLAGWRTDFSSESAATIARALAVPGDFRVGGHQLPAGERRLTISVAVEGDPIRLSAVVATGRGDAATVVLGQVGSGFREPSAELPPAAVGGRIIGLLVTEGRLVAGEGHPGVVTRATLRFDGLDGLVDASPISVEVSGTEAAVIRAPLPTDGLVLPALVSPDLAAAAARAPDGVLAITFGGRLAIRVRVAAVAERFPTLADPAGRFLVVDLAPLLVALDGAAPGSGHPNEAWLDVASPAALAQAKLALAGEPFRAAVVRARADIEAAALADPLADAFLAAMAAAAVAGLILAVLGVLVGIRADAGDATGELRNLAALGVSERSLRGLVAGRAAILAAIGVAAGLAVGAVLLIVATATVGLGASVRVPNPPLLIEWPWAIMAAAALVPAVTIAISSVAPRRARPA